MFTIRNLLLIVLLHFVSSSFYEEEKRLRKELFKNYNKDIRPVFDSEELTGVFAGLRIYVIYRLDFKAGSLVTRSTIKLAWKDSHLNWIPEDYGNITRININSDKVWMPKIFICNSQEEANKRGENTYVFTLHSDGSIIFWQAKILQTFCEIDVYAYPFDQQECQIRLCVEDQAKLHTTFVYFKYTETLVEKNYQWDVKCFGEEEDIRRPYLFAPISLTRKLKISSGAIILPSAVLSILTVCIFLLPPESGEKVSFATIVFLTNVVYLVEMDRMLNVNSKKPSLLILYLIALSSLSGICTLGAIIICKMRVMSEDKSNDEPSGNNNDSVSFTKRSGIIDIAYKINTDSGNVPVKSSTSKKRQISCCGYRRLDNIFLVLTCVTLAIYGIIFAYYFHNPPGETSRPGPPPTAPTPPTEPSTPNEDVDY